MRRRVLQQLQGGWGNAPENSLGRCPSHTFETHDVDAVRDYGGRLR
jgi:hypothetical protein